MFAAMLVGAGTVGLGCSSAAVPPDITAVPTQVAHTALGDVGYREVGKGPDLVLITGFGASMDEWAPSFVDALAQRFRVVVFDNAGVGQTAALATPLSITQMASQTSALITALGLGGCDVLGWSMGGMIAQSLAVTHPGQVRRLVLAATQPGTGNAVPVPSAIQAALDSGDPAAGLRLLFPADQAASPERSKPRRS
jgi:pimeloyl-ACP methyl ester carboxylesterase